MNNETGGTAPTPEQLRALADVCADCGGVLAACRAAPVACCPDCQHYEPRMAALRAVADQLEAARQFAKVRATSARALGREMERDWLDLIAILPAENKPQEVRNG